MSVLAFVDNRTFKRCETYKEAQEWLAKIGCCNNTNIYTNDTIYKVLTEGDGEGKTHRVLAYASGSITDIRAFYEDKRMYSLKVEPLKIHYISQDESLEKLRLRKEIAEMQKRLNELEKKYE